MRFRTPSVLLILSLLTLAACNGKKEQAQTQQHAGGGGGRGGFGPIPVSVSRVERKDVPVFLTGLGTVQAYNTVTLKSRIDGQIVAVYFKEGQYVKKGQLLALIDPRPYQVALQTAQANLARDQAQLNTAQANLARSAALLKEGVIAQQDYDTQRASAGQYEGTVQADKAAIENAKLNLVYTRITSPIDGRIGLKLIDPGNMVHASDTNGMLVVTQMQPIAATFTLPQDQLQSVLLQLRRGQLKVDAYSRDDRTLISSGHLETVDNQIDVTTGTAKLKAVFDNKDGSLWPNQFVNIHLLLSTAKNALVIPTAAIQRGPQGNIVYVVKPDNTVGVQPVDVTLTAGNTAVIAVGLSEGQQVVTDGQDKLQAGSQISPRSPNVNGSGNPNGNRNPNSGAPKMADNLGGGQ